VFRNTRRWSINNLTKQSNAYTCLDRPKDSRRLRLPEFLDHQHVKVIRLPAALCTVCLYQQPPPKMVVVLISVRGWSWLQDHSVARRIKLMKNPNDPIQNQTKDLPGCSGLPQSSVPLHTTITQQSNQKIGAYNITTGLNKSHNMSVYVGGGGGGGTGAEIIRSHGVCRPIFGLQVLRINKVLV
jgi:hypothetical protein